MIKENDKFTRSFNRSKINFNLKTSLKISLVSIIFLSIVPYASSYVWIEALFCTAIFIIAIVYLFDVKSIKEIFRESKLFYPLICLAIYSIIQGLMTLLVQENIIPASSFLPYSFDLTASFWVAVKIFAFVCFIKLLLECFRRQINLLVWSLLATGNAFALFGVCRFLLQNRMPGTFGYFLFPQLKPGLGFGTFINQNHFAYLMLMTIGLNICLLWWGKISNQIKGLLLFCSLMSFAALILTASRGGIISLFGLLACIIFFPSKGTKLERSDKNKHLKLFKKFAAFIAVSLILIAGVIFIGQDRVVTRFEQLPQQMKDAPVDLSFKRIDVYKATIEIIKENPVYGIGFGGFRYAVSKHIDISGNIVPEQGHNDYLEYIASGGLIAVVFGLLFIFNFVSEVRKNFYDSEDSIIYAAKIGAISGIVGISIHNLFDFSLQMFANLLFFAALIVIAIQKENVKINEFNENSKINNADQKLIIYKFLPVILFALLIGCSALFGFSRFVISHSENVISSELIELPFDSEFYEKNAVFKSKFGDNWEAQENLKKALKYRPNDYFLWLKLGQNQQTLKQNKNAENSFRTAINLAPHYSVPQLNFGLFLIETDHKNEGFKYLHQAFRGNPGYFYKVAEIAWKETGNNGKETIDLLSPLKEYEAGMLNMFFLDKQKYSLVVDVTCRNESLPDAHRGVLVQKLLEKRQYYFAHAIYKRLCKEDDEKITEFEDGSFANAEIDDRIGFGWRVNNLPEDIKIEVQDKNSAERPTNLKINFSGANDPATPIITQLLIVEQNQKYQIDLAYKANEITTGGIPVLMIIPKKQDADGVITEIPLQIDEIGWIKKSVIVDTDSTTEAFEIRLARRSCVEKLCPIYGSLQITDFAIRKK